MMQVNFKIFNLDKLYTLLALINHKIKIISIKVNQIFYLRINTLKCNINFSHNQKKEKLKF